MKARVSDAGLRRRGEDVEEGFVGWEVGREDRMIWKRDFWMSEFSVLGRVFRYWRRAMRVLRTSSSVPMLVVVMKPRSIGRSELESWVRVKRKWKYETLDVEYIAVRSRSWAVKLV